MRPRDGLNPHDIQSLESALPSLFADYVARQSPPVCGTIEPLGQPDDSRVTCLDRKQRQPYQKPTLPLTIGAARSSGSVTGSTPDVTAPIPTQQHAPPVAVPDAGACPVAVERGVLADCELGRLCDNRDEALLYRLLCYGHVFANGSGKIKPDELHTRCIQMGIQCSRRTFDNWIQRGNRLYWHKRGGYLYLTGWRKLARKLTKWAAKYAPQTVATNLPGQNRVKLDLTGDAQSVRAALYGGWLTVKAAKNGHIDISRYTLGLLWRRSRKALQRYEQMLGIRVEERYAEDTDTCNPLIPAHAYLCLDTEGGEFASWRLSNRYIPSFADIHPANGQRRKVRSACRDVVDVTNPAIQSAGGANREQRTGKLYFEDRQTKRGLKLGHKTLNKHLGKHQDAGTQAHYCLIGQRYGKHIYECSTGNRLRGLQIVRDRVGEQSDAFTARRTLWRRHWADRGKST